MDNIVVIAHDEVAKKVLIELSYDSAIESQSLRLGKNVYANCYYESIGISGLLLNLALVDAKKSGKSGKKIPQTPAKAVKSKTKAVKPKAESKPALLINTPNAEVVNDTPVRPSLGTFTTPEGMVLNLDDERDLLWYNRKYNK